MAMLVITRWYHEYQCLYIIMIFGIIWVCLTKGESTQNGDFDRENDEALNIWGNLGKSWRNWDWARVMAMAVPISAWCFGLVSSFQNGWFCGSLPTWEGWRWSWNMIELVTSMSPVCFLRFIKDPLQFGNQESSNTMGNSADHGDLTETSAQVVTTNGLVLQVGMGLSNGLLKDAKEFLSNPNSPEAAAMKKPPQNIREPPIETRSSTEVFMGIGVWRLYLSMFIVLFIIKILRG